MDGAEEGEGTGDGGYLLNGNRAASRRFAGLITLLLQTATLRTRADILQHPAENIRLPVRLVVADKKQGEVPLLENNFLNAHTATQPTEAYHIQ